MITGTPNIPIKTDCGPPLSSAAAAMQIWMLSTVVKNTHSSGRRRRSSPSEPTTTSASMKVAITASAQVACGAMKTAISAAPIMVEVRATRSRSCISRKRARWAGVEQSHEP